MNPDRLIVDTYILSENLSTRPYNQTNLTHKSADTNNAPRDPLRGPVTLLMFFSNVGPFYPDVCVCSLDGTRYASILLDSLSA